MPRFLLPHVCLLCALITAEPVRSQVPDQHFRFSDKTAEAGLSSQLKNMNGHGAAWGDVNGDGQPDLYIGTFFKEGLKPNLLFINNKGKFVPQPTSPTRIQSRSTGMVMADFDNDGDLDIYVGSMPHVQDKNFPKALRGNSLFRNDGNGAFTDISKNNGACPSSFGGRSVTVLDFDGDGLLDILAGEDPIKGYSGSSTSSSRLFRNKGNMQFEDVTASAGIPADLPALGVAAADMNNDGWPDIFLVASEGNCVLLMNDGKGKFRVEESSRELFSWKGAGKSDMICGISFSDVNRDGLSDIVLGPHFDRPWAFPQPVRLFLNRGQKDGRQSFEEVTEKAGLKPLHMKAPHVEIQDFDNDGWPDIYASIVKYHNGKPYPYIAKHLGIRNGIPLFQDRSMEVNDFPTEEDRSMSKGRTAPFYEKMIADKKISYSAAGPVADYDNDGRLDLILPSWWVEIPSLLLRNETSAGNWIRVKVKPPRGVNRMAIGARIMVYKNGGLGKPDQLIGTKEVATGYGYASGQPAEPHFGLGKEQVVDIEVILPHDKGRLRKEGVRANALVTVE